MNLERLSQQLLATIPTLQSMLTPINKDQVRWRPAPEKWSILDVINHLADEERVDFRQRLDLTLHHPEQDWPGINPDVAVKDPRYKNRSLQEALDDFIAERHRSLQWLDSLGSPDWNQAHVHARFGLMCAGELMAAWVAHDLLHLRQLIRLKWEYLATQTEPFGLDYAGSW
ncbi:MAG: DinB family protein [Chlorobi bacterium]|nr:DinB family protein [Chlorobiota bacterium]